jgi:hypothetical protein
MFTAAPSAVGYLYQARFALAVCLRYAYSDSGVEVAVERMDDVSFEADGTPLELLQTKHHIHRIADLTDACPDLWKTIRVWSEQALTDPGLPNRTRLILITTGKVPQNTAAWLLRLSGAEGLVTGGNAKEAAAILTEVAQTSQNRSLKAAFAAFLALTPRMRASLLSAVQVLDNQPLLNELDRVIEHGIRMAAPRGQASNAREMLEGWWWPRICQALVQTPAGRISVTELETKLDEIREALHRNALIAGFEHAEPPTDELARYDDFGFIRQLRTIGVGGNRVELAKRDYYRAFAQRSHWTREHVVLDGEIAKFEATLVEEWEPRFHAMCEMQSDATPDTTALRQAGQELFQWVENEARFPFRTLVKRFLNVGSFHILANGLRVGWHRDFAQLCRDQD